MTISPPPAYAKMVEEDNSVTLPWLQFFNQAYQGDTGIPSTGSGSWTPNFSGLTTVGTPVITGNYFRSGQFIDFEVRIVPATSTSATSGTTYIDNLPFITQRDAPCFAMAGTTGIAFGVIQSSTNRVYVPTWSAVTTVLTISGRVRAS